MADFDPFGRYNETEIVNQVFEETGAAGWNDLSEAWKYQDVTNLQYESQLVKMVVDDFYKAFKDKGLKTGPIDYNDFELLNNKLKVKGSSIDLVSKITGKPLALTSIKSIKSKGDQLCLKKLDYTSLRDYHIGLSNIDKNEHKN